MIFGAEFFFFVAVVVGAVAVVVLGVPAAGVVVAVAVALVADNEIRGASKLPEVNNCSSVSEVSSEDCKCSENPTDFH